MGHITVTRPWCVRIVALLSFLVTLAIAFYPAGTTASAQGTFAPSIPAEPAATAQQPYVPDQLLVRFAPSLASVQVEAMLAQQGISLISYIAPIHVSVLHLPPDLSVEKAITSLKGAPGVEFAEPNYIYSVAQITDPGMDKNQWAPQKIGAPDAWLATAGDPDIVIAVVDTGVDYLHSELAPNMWANSDEIPNNGIDDDGNNFTDDVSGWDFANNDNDPLDDHFHGTHVAGIAAASPGVNDSGIVGICPHCSIMAVKVMTSQGSGTIDNIANGITYAADNGARVINMSLGGSAGSTTLESAVNYAWARGVVVVAAAGNDGKDARLYPAAYPNAMAVASTNIDDYHSCFSNYGSGYVSVAAPGELIYSTTPRDASGDTYATYSGTSMATPHVSGLAGLLISQDPTRSNTAVRDLIESTADDLGAKGIDAHFGYGRISAMRAVRPDTPRMPPPAGMFSDQASATGYSNARKLVRADGLLHIVWHGSNDGESSILHARSTDGVTWNEPLVAYSSAGGVYNPALATDGSSLFVAFATSNGASGYQVKVISKALPDGAWTELPIVLGNGYDAVRPGLFLDPSNGRLHLVASSNDSSRAVYYASSSDGGLTWSPVREVALTGTSSQMTRYAAVHASGDYVFIAARSLERTFFGLLTSYRIFGARSLNGGVSWSAPLELGTNSSSNDYGFSLAGVGERLYLAYEQGGSIYFRSSGDGVAWSAAQTLGSGTWPSVTQADDGQADDGQAWVAWESSGSLLLRRYVGSTWQSADTIVTGSGLCKVSYPSLKLGTSAGRLEWVSTNCPGAPYRLVYDGRTVSALPAIPSISFSAANFSVSEGAGTAVATVKLSSASDRQVTVKYASSDGTAVVYKDYSSASGTLTFAAGETSKTFSVAIREDTIDEPDETVKLTLSSATDAMLGEPTSATITIVDNDAAPSVLFSSSTTYVQENAGQANVAVRLSAASAYAVTVDYATSDGSANAGSDYTGASGTLTFAPGETSKSFPVPLVDDAALEPNETINLRLSNPANAVLGSPVTAGITIWANDSISFSLGSTYVQENTGLLTLSVRLNAPSSVPVSVDYTTVDGSANAGGDFTAARGTLTFAPGDTSESFTVTVNDDTQAEANEAFSVQLSNPVNAGLGSPASETVTIYANDAVLFSSAGVSVHENAGVATLTVKLSGPSSLPVTVSYATTDGTALAGSDYTTSSGTVTFAPGDTSEAITIPLIDDTLAEANETFTIQLNSPSNANLGAPATATVTIYGNDSVSFSSSSAYVHENAGTASLTVKLSDVSSVPVSVGYAMVNGTALAGSDFVAADATLTFAPGETAKTVAIAITDDTVAEAQEAFSVKLSNASGAELGATATATVNIWANDSVAFYLSSTYVQENAGAATVTVKLSDSSSTPVTVSYATADGTALQGSDYVATNGTLTFAPGETSKTFTVQIIDDTAAEPNETIKLALSNPSNAGLGSPASATLTVYASDSVSFGSSYYYVQESAGTAAITVKLSGPSSQVVTVAYATSDGTAIAGSDYTAASGMFTFAPGETTKTFNVTILADGVAEPSETIKLALSNPANASLGTATATLTIFAN